MAKEKKIEVGAINITMHPHSPESYLSLFNVARRKKIIKRMHSDKYGMIASVMPLDKNRYGQFGPVHGDIYRFTQLDPKGTWFNTKTSDRAENEDLAAIAIPPHLKPNSSRFTYIFFPEDHILFFEKYYDGNTLSYSSAETLIRNIFNDPKITEEYGEVDVTLVPCADELMKALAMEKLEKLSFKIRRPNPDHQDEAEKEVLRRMNNLKVAEVNQEYKVIPGQSIKVDDKLLAEAKVAAKFGKVEAKGKDSGSRPVSYVTSEHPWKASMYYDPDIESAFETLVEKVLSVKDRLTSWFK